tara:strand:- start:1845 stop:2303 length:459 start_codon:yes stop_codon:yes gene_type:complete
MKLFRKYLIFNLSFFLIHLVLQNIFKQFINSNYLLLLLEFSLFAFIFTIKFLSKKERIVILFSLSNLVIYLFFIWVIEKSLSIDLLIFMLNSNELLTIEQVSNANNLIDMTSFRIDQGINSGLVESIGNKFKLSDRGVIFTRILNYIRNLYF